MYLLQDIKALKSLWLFSSKVFKYYISELYWLFSLSLSQFCLFICSLEIQYPAPRLVLIPFAEAGHELLILPTLPANC